MRLLTPPYEIPPCPRHTCSSHATAWIVLPGCRLCILAHVVSHCTIPPCVHSGFGSTSFISLGRYETLEPTVNRAVSRKIESLVCWELLKVGEIEARFPPYQQGRTVQTAPIFFYFFFSSPSKSQIRWCLGRMP